MGVVMRGGTSGNRQDAKPPVPNSGKSQPVLETQTSGGIPGTIHFPASKSTSPESSRSTASMPTGGTIPTGSSDVEEQGLPTGR